MERMTENVTRKGVIRRRRLGGSKTRQLALLTIPGIIWLITFCYVPMGGSIVAFKNFKPKTKMVERKWRERTETGLCSVQMYLQIL